MSARPAVKQQISSVRDPVRRVYRWYCGLVTVEGALMIVALAALLVILQWTAAFFVSGGLGYGRYILALGLSYLAVIWIFQPLYFWSKATSLPKTQALPELLKVVIPTAEACKGDIDELRRALGKRHPVHYLRMTRFYRNLLLAVLLGAAALLLLLMS